MTEALVVAGVLELTAGVLSGWLMVASSSADWTRRLRLRDTRRIRQGHLDLLMMGTILTAIGAAVPSVPPPVVVPIVAGSWLAPLLFFPLAWEPTAGGHRAMVWLDRTGFVALTLGYLALAGTVVGRTLS